MHDSGASPGRGVSSSSGRPLAPVSSQPGGGSNLLAGLLLLFYRPFARHDQIAVTGFEGVVSEIDLRYTTLQRDDGQVLIPNSILFTNPIVLQRGAARGTGAAA
jgi:hypothetical protein